MHEMLAVSPDGPIEFSISSRTSRALTLTNLSIECLCVVPICSSAFVRFSNQCVLLEAFQEAELKLTYNVPSDASWDPADTVFRLAVTQIAEELLDDDHQSINRQSVLQQSGRNILERLEEQQEPVRFISEDRPVLCRLDPQLTTV